MPKRIDRRAYMAQLRKNRKKTMRSITDPASRKLLFQAALWSDTHRVPEFDIDSPDFDRTLHDVLPYLDDVTGTGSTAFLEVLDECAQNLASFTRNNPRNGDPHTLTITSLFLIPALGRADTMTSEKHEHLASCIATSLGENDVFPETDIIIVSPEPIRPSEITPTRPGRKAGLTRTIHNQLISGRANQDTYSDPVSATFLTVEKPAPDPRNWIPFFLLVACHAETNHKTDHNGSIQPNVLKSRNWISPEPDSDPGRNFVIGAPTKWRNARNRITQLTVPEATRI